MSLKVLVIRAKYQKMAEKLSSKRTALYIYHRAQNRYPESFFRNAHIMYPSNLEYSKYELERIANLARKNANALDSCRDATNGNTLLHHAAACGNVQLTGMLLAAGASMDCLNQDGKKPKEVACTSLLPESPFVTACLEADFRVNENDVPKLLSRKECFNYIIELFEIAEAYKNADNAEAKTTPISSLFARYKREIEADNVYDETFIANIFKKCRKDSWNEYDRQGENNVSRLIEFTLRNPNLLTEARDQNQNTLLHAACMYGNINLVALLIELGAPTDSLNVDGKTPREIACTSMDPNIHCFCEEKVDMSFMYPSMAPLIPLVYTEEILIENRKFVMPKFHKYESPEYGEVVSCQDFKCYHYKKIIEILDVAEAEGYETFDRKRPKN